VFRQKRKEELSITGMFIFQLHKTYFNRSYVFFKYMLATEYNFMSLLEQSQKRTITRMLAYKLKENPFNMNVDFPLSLKIFQNFTFA